MITVFIVVVCAYCVWFLYAAAGSGRYAAVDRLKLATATLEALLGLVLAQVVIDWTPLLGLAWVAGFAALGPAVVLVVRRGRQLPWITAEAPRKLRWRRVVAPVYAAVLIVAVGLGYATLL